MPNDSEGLDKIIGRVQKLIEHAERSGTEEEADAFWTRANAIMEEHEIEMADLLKKRTGDDSTFKIERVIFQLSPHNSYIKEWRRLVLASIAEFTNTLSLLHGGNHGVLVGRKIDIEIGVQLFMSATNQIYERSEYEAGKAYTRGEIGRGGKKIHGRQWRETFCQAAAFALDRRISLMVAARHQVSNTSALLVTTKTDIDAFMQEHSPKIKTAKAWVPEVKSRTAATLGKKAGEEVNLGPALDQPYTSKKLPSGKP